MTGTQTARRIGAVAVSALLVGGALAACSSTKTTTTSTSPSLTPPAASGSSPESSSASSSAGAIKSGLKVYYIPKDTQNPYEVLADDGGTMALTELGGTPAIGGRRP